QEYRGRLLRVPMYVVRRSFFRLPTSSLVPVGTSVDLVLVLILYRLSQSRVGQPSHYPKIQPWIINRQVYYPLNTVGTAPGGTMGAGKLTLLPINSVELDRTNPRIRRFLEIHQG